MRKSEKKQILEIFQVLRDMHKTIEQHIANGETDMAGGLLGECQQTALQVGNFIESTEGEACRAIQEIAAYCEALYQISVEMLAVIPAGKAEQTLNRQLFQIEQCIRKEIPERKEIVFLPYKAAMWDSLESVWQAACADPDCEAYVVPIPYYEKNLDRSFGKIHYEGADFPENVPITYFEDYSLEQRHPDVVYIHNPYDHANLVTSVDPAYYSYAIRPHTDCLVYIPYYTTSGGMSEARRDCSAYFQADYIVTQSEGYRAYFDERIPDEKLLPFGSPKFDRVLRMCKNPPDIPEAWKEKMLGRKVFFYNTSIGSMVKNTADFLRKMQYVFQCFGGRSDICLLWRPHPLMENTMASLYPQFLPVYQKLKEYFLLSGLGIYDDTPDVEKSISLSDVYIGEAGSSIVSLFGMAGKPLFILNNNILAAPDQDDWKGALLTPECAFRTVEWLVSEGNQLYYSPEKNYHYTHFCSLSDSSAPYQYRYVVAIQDKIYVCPAHAQDIPVVENGVLHRIPLKQQEIKDGTIAFRWLVHDEEYLFLIPIGYPAIVRCHLQTRKIDYFTENLNVFVKQINGGCVAGGACIHKGRLFIASPTDGKVLIMDVKTGDQQICEVGSQKEGGSHVIVSDGTELWLLPWLGSVIRRWNPDTGEVSEYAAYPECFVCRHPIEGTVCSELPFISAAFEGEYVYFSAHWGNKCIRLNRNTGEMQEYEMSFSLPQHEKNGYFKPWVKCAFISEIREHVWLMVSFLDGILYEVDLKTGNAQEIELSIEKEELLLHEPGFAPHQHLQYACMENGFNSLSRFLDGHTAGNAFDAARQMAAFRTISANSDGTCGEKVHRFIMEQLKRRSEEELL